MTTLNENQLVRRALHHAFKKIAYEIHDTSEEGFNAENIGEGPVYVLKIESLTLPVLLKAFFLTKTDIFNAAVETSAVYESGYLWISSNSLDELTRLYSLRSARAET